MEFEASRGWWGLLKSLEFPADFRSLFPRAFDRFMEAMHFLGRAWGPTSQSILLKKSFSENQKKIFRTQMPYNERSDLG